MAINTNQAKEIKELLRRKIDEKLKNYTRETSSMPFLAKLIQDSEKVAAYSFIHSLATTLGMSIYEKISEIVALTHYDEVKTGYDVDGMLSCKQKEILCRI